MDLKIFFFFWNGDFINDEKDYNIGDTYCKTNRPLATGKIPKIFPTYYQMTNEYPQQTSETECTHSWSTECIHRQHLAASDMINGSNLVQVWHP